MFHNNNLYKQSKNLYNRVEAIGTGKQEHIISEL